MKIVGCDLHTRYEQIAMLDAETGELTEPPGGRRTLSAVTKMWVAHRSRFSNGGNGGIQIKAACIERLRRPSGSEPDSERFQYQLVHLDQDGQQMNSDTISNTNHLRRVDLSQYAGKAIYSISLLADGNTTPGSSWRFL